MHADYWRVIRFRERGVLQPCKTVEGTTEAHPEGFSQPYEET